MPDFKTVDWNETIPRACLFAQIYIDKLKWIGMTPPTANDMVLEVVEKFIIGERTWRKDIDPVRQLCLNVKSHISNLVNSRKNRISNVELDNPCEVLPLDDYRLQHESTENRVLDAEASVFITLFLNAMLKLLQERDPVLAKAYLHLLEDGMDSPRELANALGISVREANNIKRRLKRLLTPFLDDGSLNANTLDANSE